MSGALAPIIRHPGAIAVYLSYAAHADGEGYAWLADTTIARAHGVSLDAVTRGRRVCVTAGLIADTGTYRQRCRVYRVSMTTRTDEGTPPANEASLSSATPRMNAGSDGRGTTRVSEGSAETTTRIDAPRLPASVRPTTRTGAADYPHGCGSKDVEGSNEGRRKGVRSRESAPTTNPDEAAARANLRRHMEPVT